MHSGRRPAHARRQGLIFTARSWSPLIMTDAALTCMSLSNTSLWLPSTATAPAMAACGLPGVQPRELPGSTCCCCLPVPLAGESLLQVTSNPPKLLHSMSRSAGGRPMHARADQQHQ
jgi:hypothetical protein